jgi:hypothetical protein
LNEEGFSAVPGAPPSLLDNLAALTTAKTGTGVVTGVVMGISKTKVRKKCASLGNFAHAETFPLSHAGAYR